MNRESLDNGLRVAQLGLTLLVLAFAPAALGSVRPSELVYVYWGILAVAGIWLIRLWVQAPYRYLFPPIAWTMLPFVAYAGWRYWTADIEFVARQEFLLICFLTLFFLVLVNDLHGQTAQRTLAFGLIAIGTIISMYAIYQWLTKSERVLGFNQLPGYYGRGSGTYICPNHFAGFVEMCLPLSVALAFSGRLRVVPRLLLAYAALVMFVGIAASGSRGGWICSILSLLLLAGVLVTRRGFRWTTLIVAVALIGGGSMLYTRAVHNRMKHSFRTGYERENRLRLWDAAYKIWRDNPWWGVGPDHFDYRYRAYREATDKTQGRPGRVHNDYLNTLTDYGVAGFLLLLFPLGTTAWLVIRSWRFLNRSSDEVKGRESNRSALMLGAACGLFAILVHSVFDFNLHIPANALTAVALLAIITAHLRFASSRWWITARWPLKVVGSILLIGAVGVLGRETARRTTEVVAIGSASKAAAGSAEQMAQLRKAVAAQPKDPDAWFVMGEHLRTSAWPGGPGHEKVMADAIRAYEQAAALNRWDPHAQIRAGMCLDWIEKHDQAEVYFKRAIELDPNSYYTRAMVGWHYFQAGNYKQAQYWNNKSLEVNWLANQHAITYRPIIERALAEEARSKTADAASHGQ